MIIEVMKSKIHRVRVTQAELNYVGSITIDEDLMDAANIIANEKYRSLTTITEQDLKHTSFLVKEVPEQFV